MPSTQIFLNVVFYFILFYAFSQFHEKIESKHAWKVFEL